MRKIIPIIMLLSWLSPPLLAAENTELKMLELRQEMIKTDVANNKEIAAKDIQSTKELLQKQVEELDKRIIAYNTRFDNLNLYATLFTIIFAGISILIGIAAYFTAESNARKAAKKWLDDNGDEIKKKIERMYNEVKEKHEEAINVIQDITKATQTQIDKVAEDVAEDDEKLGFNYWYKKGLNAYFKKDLNGAATFFDKAAKSTTDQVEIARTMVNKGVALRMLGRPEESIAIYNELIARFGGASEGGLREQVVKAMFNKGVTLGMLEKPKEAIAIYDELIRLFGTASEAGIREEVVKATVNKGGALGMLGQFEAAIAIYDELITHFGSVSEAGICEQVAKAHNSKGNSLRNLAKQKFLAAPEKGEEFMDNLRASLPELEKALPILPNNPSVIGNRGYALFLLGDDVAAAVDLRRAFELGGEAAYYGERGDANINHLGKIDDRFKALLDQLWNEVKPKT
jgi:tetratricopeptide (TPR) repeat protein